MGRKSNKRYSPKFKFTVVLEVLKSEKGAKVFGGSEEVKEYEDRIGQLERIGLVAEHRDEHGLNRCLEALGTGSSGSERRSPRWRIVWIPIDWSGSAARRS